MKKILIIGFVALLSVALTYGFADAVTGACVNCHTMHNSQGGAPMRYDANATPLGILLRGDCLGCHSNTAANTIKGGTVPVVFNTSGGTTDPGIAQSWSGATYNLAGGNFYYTYGTTAVIDAKGHDVDFIDPSVGDATLGNTPPGWNATDDEATTDYSSSNRLTCAGQQGCHGNRNITTGNYDAIKGAHHTNAGGNLNTADTIGNSFRFLKGVKGYEDPDWQQSASVNDHNEYFGATARGTLAATYTISALCRQCHGLFHSSIGTATPWTRHPTDTDVIAKGGEYANYNDLITGNAYSLEAPVGKITSVAGARSIVTSGDSPVICLSCHRAHGSPYADILRWDYSLMIAGGGSVGTGCFRCHTTKD